VQAVRAAAGSGMPTIPLHQAGYVINPPSGLFEQPGVSIHLPGLASSLVPALPVQYQGRILQPVGYTREHAAYASTCQQLAQHAYTTHAAEVVVVEVRVVVKPAGRIKEEMVYVCVSTFLCQLRILLIICGMHQDITETVGDIPVHIGAVHLKQILYEKVQPL